MLTFSWAMAQETTGISSVSASTNQEEAPFAFGQKAETAWSLDKSQLENGQWLMFTLQTPGDVCEINLQAQGLSKNALKSQLNVFVTYDPMNLGDPVDYTVDGDSKNCVLRFELKYGAHIRFGFNCTNGMKPFSLKRCRLCLRKKR